MAENINISFAPNKSASESQRIADLEQYVSTLTERTKFAFASIIEEYNDTSADNEQQTVNMIYQTASESGSDVGQFTTQWFSEIFNDYENNVATTPYSHAEGYRTSAKGLHSHAEGYSTVTSNDNAHAEGYGTEASGNTSHAEGSNTKATGWVSHAEGDSTIASGMYSHAEGGKSESKAKYSHAEGELTQTEGTASHAEGSETVASGMYSHAGGKLSESADYCSFVHGLGLKTSVRNATVFGEYNDYNTQSLFSIGCGNSDEYRVNALTVDGGGNLWIKGQCKADYGYDFSNAIASDTVLGAIKVGENLSISEDGTLSASGGNSYVLPSATADTLGGVKIGDNVSVTADGTISVDLSAYLKSTDISDWAKQSDKPTYTANEIGLGNVNNTADADKPISTATQIALDGKADTGHTHTVSDITDMPEWTKTENKPVYTAEEVGAVTAEDMDAKTYLKAIDITGQTVDLNDYKLNQLTDKGKSLRCFCSVATSENITNRPVSVSEPFELVTTNIRHASTDAYHTVQKYTSATRKRTYTRWCANGTWSDWKCDTDVVVYGSVTEDSPKTFAYATYGEGFGVVEIEAYYDNATNPVRNRKVFALSPTASIERVMLTISNGSSESVTLANGTITMSMTGTTALSFVIRYTNSR